MMRRKHDLRLDAWMRSGCEKPLVLLGARGTGKSTSVEKLTVRSDRKLVRVDFANDPQARTLFKHVKTPQEIVYLISILSKQKIDASNTILFLDEIQRSEHALASFKRISKEMRGLPVVVSGSSLGVRVGGVSENGAFFNGVEALAIHPLDFEEFCDALGERDAFDAAIGYIERGEVCPIHEKMMCLYWEYLLVGGMPQAVARYREDRRFEDARSAQEGIRLSYAASMSEDAADADPAKIFATWRSLPGQLAKATGSTKFMWKHIAEGAKAERYQGAFDWLRRAGMVNVCKRIGDGPEDDEDASSFKAYVVDTGLLSRSYGAGIEDVSGYGHNEALGFGGGGAQSTQMYRQVTFGRGLAENFIMQELVSVGMLARYWGMRSKHEAEFVLDTSAGMVPVEVACGPRRSRATSARAFAGRYGSPFVVQVSRENIARRNVGGVEVRTVPPYAFSRVVAAL